MVTGKPPASPAVTPPASARAWLISMTPSTARAGRGASAAAPASSSPIVHGRAIMIVSPGHTVSRANRIAAADVGTDLDPTRHLHFGSAVVVGQHVAGVAS